METSADDKPLRGRLLAGWLMVNALLNIALVYLFASTILGLTQASSPTLRDRDFWAGLILIVVGVINIAAILAIWRWRKLGLYIFVVMAVPGFLAYLVLDTRLLTAIFPLTSAALTWSLLRPKWHYFY